jgi:hypothetical protein
MKLLVSLPALYLVYKGLTHGVSPVIIQPEEPPTGLTDEQKAEQQERERQRKLAEDESIRKQKEIEQQKFREQTLEELKWQAEQEAIRQTPQIRVGGVLRQLTCKYGWLPVLKGNGTRNNPYYWVCEKVGRLGF